MTGEQQRGRGRRSAAEKPSWAGLEQRVHGAVMRGAAPGACSLAHTATAHLRASRRQSSSHSHTCSCPCRACSRLEMAGLGSTEEWRGLGRSISGGAWGCPEGHRGAGFGGNRAPVRDSPRAVKYRTIVCGGDRVNWARVCREKGVCVGGEESGRRCRIACRLPFGDIYRATSRARRLGRPSLRACAVFWPNICHRAENLGRQPQAGVG